MQKYLYHLLLSVLSAFSSLSISAQNGVDRGHRYIDLGLPSGTKWAECNVGASSKTDYGDYYAWGETSVKSSYDKANYEYKGDVAEQKWGYYWCMPTKEDVEELVKYTTNKRDTIDGVYGRLFTAKNGNSIFLPAAGVRIRALLRNAGAEGFYWTISRRPHGPGRAYGLYFDWGNVCFSYGYDRDEGHCYGHPVRPVRRGRFK